LVLFPKKFVKIYKKVVKIELGWVKRDKKGCWLRRIGCLGSKLELFAIEKQS